MRVAHIIDSLAWGGAQKLLVTFAEAARTSNVDVTIITLQADKKGAPFTSQIQALGTRMVAMHAPRLLHLPRLIRLVRFLKQERFDVVHTHLNNANILGPLACALTGTPVVASLHNMRIDTHLNSRKKLEIWTLRYLAKRIVAVGQQVADARQFQFPRTPLVVIPNAVTLISPLAQAEREVLRAELVGDTARPLLISVGRLTPLKGGSDLLTAFAQVCKIHPQAALIIVGDGSDLEVLAEKIRVLELENNARLLGARSDVPRLLGASDLYVSASLFEGLPVAMLEAMAVGLPVAATEVGDVPLVLTPRTGVGVPPGEPAQLAQAINQLLSNPEQLPAMGRAAREHVAQHYSPSIWLDKLLSLYNEVCLADRNVVPLSEAK